MELKYIILLVLVLIAILVIGLVILKHRDNDSIYVHLKTGDKYRIYQECLMKFNGEWMDAIIYYDINSYEMYVREYNDFILNFKKLLK